MSQGEVNWEAPRLEARNPATYEYRALESVIMEDSVFSHDSGLNFGSTINIAEDAQTPASSPLE
jgi:hypothetical protein